MKPGFFESQFYKYLGKQGGRGFKIVAPSGTYSFGDAGDPAAEMTVKDPEFFRHLVLHGDIGFGEGYMFDMWDSPRPEAVIRWIVDNADPRNAETSALERFAGMVVKRFGNLHDRIRHVLRPNNKRIARRNIAEHYDLSNDFFSLWLDDSMAYSSALFLDENESLRKAQENKFDALCRRLDLKPEDHLLEVGCGWGGFALFAAGNYGCRVTGITISEKQFQLARERVREAGLEDRIEIQLKDYRDVRGQFDKIVSIEMVEALGFRYFDAFFEQMNRLLAPRGVMGLQAITVPDQTFTRYRKGADWIQKYIFPGGLCLSIYEIMASLMRTGELTVYHQNSMGPHYGRTLQLWRERFDQRLDEVRALGFDEVFLRRWRFYLAWCEACFFSRKLNVVQLILSRPNNPSLVFAEAEPVAVLK